MNNVHFPRIRTSLIRTWLLVALLATGPAGAAGDVQLSLGPTFPRNAHYPPSVGHLAALYGIGVSADYPVLQGGPLFVATGGNWSTSEYLFFMDENCLCYQALDFWAGLRLRGRLAGRVTTYAGIGGLAIAASVRSNGATISDDSSVGYYGEIGGLVPLWRRLSLGAEARIVWGTRVTVSGATGDAGSTRIAVVAAYSFR
jgi:hypothetical protein